MSAHAPTIPAVRRSVTVDRSVEEAFRVFTDGIASGWPLDSHSLASGREDVTAETVVLEARAGGRLYERMSDGKEGYWGTITSWEPPRRVVISWKVDPDAAAPTEIEVTFSPDGERTRVELEHRGWERLGEQARAARDGYDGGWKTVLGRYASAFEEGVR
jgi:uncharacterized protein YndB with AHSA1/START domain